MFVCNKEISLDLILFCVYFEDFRFKTMVYKITVDSYVYTLIIYHQWCLLAFDTKLVPECRKYIR